MIPATTPVPPISRPRLSDSLNALSDPCTETQVPSDVAPTNAEFFGSDTTYDPELVPRFAVLEPGQRPRTYRVRFYYHL